MSGRMMKFSDGDTIFSESQAADHMYLIKSGKVDIYRVRDGKKTQLAVLKPGDFFGEMALFDSKPRSATAVAVGPTELEVLEKNEFVGLCNSPVVWEMLMKMSQRIREVDEALEKLNLEKTSRQEGIGALLERRSWFV